MHSLTILNLKKYFAYFYSVLIVLGVFKIMYLAVNSNVTWFSIVISVVLISWAFFLTKQMNSAYEFTKCMCVFLALMIPIAVFNPFAALDGNELPAYTSVSVLLIEALLLSSAYIFGYRKPKP